jgi:phosphohistidine phosphatase
MRQLLLLRHAKSSMGEAAPLRPDHERTLNSVGVAAAAAMGAAMRTLNLAPDLVLVSSARRTLQTLDALEPWDEAPLIETLDTLYLATAPAILGILNGVNETVRSVLVIGHNPGLHDVALALAGPASPASNPARRLQAGFPTGALAEFTIAAHWSDLAPGNGRLVRFLSPKDLPEPAR